MNSLKIKPWTAVVSLVGTCFAGFLGGTEYQHVQSLEVKDYDIDGLMIDKSIFERALSEEIAKELPDPWITLHLQSQLNFIKHDIAKAGK